MTQPEPLNIAHIRALTWAKGSPTLMRACDEVEVLRARVTELETALREIADRVALSHEGNVVACEGCYVIRAARRVL